MKLLVSTGLFYPSHLGGPANTLYWLAKALVGEGVKVSVVTTDNHIELGKIEADAWSNVSGIRVRYCHYGPLSLWKELYHIRKELRSCDTVMLSDMFQRQVLPVAFMARLCRKRIIWSPRGELFAPALAGSWIKRWYIAVVRRCFGRYAVFHATSNEERELILSHLGNNAKVVVIPNYIDLPLQLEREQSSNPYLLYVGRISQIKALDRLIMGLSQSEKFVTSGFKLLLAGPNQNDYQQKLEKMIEEKGLQGKIVFLGNVLGHDKFQLYANAYFSCLLSHSENFGNVVIEALSQGTPVIASTGTSWEVLENTNSGYWIDNSPDSIAQCIDQALGLSERQYAEMRHNARELASSYDVAQNIGKWLEVLDNQ